jgi:ribosomal protein S18 acetylase RimI-like enzyme
MTAPATTTAAGILRPAGPADVPAIAEIQVRGWRWGYRGLLPAAYLAALEIEPRAQMWRRMLCVPEVATRLLVWEQDGHIRGFAALGSARDEEINEEFAPQGWGKLLALYIDEELAGRGAGPALHDAALEALRAAGHHDAVLWVLETNARARAFYARRGWAPDGRRKRCMFGDEHRTELRLARRL